MMLKALCLFLVIGFAAPYSISSVVSRILDLVKGTKSNRPVILVLNRDALEPSSSNEYNRPSSEETGKSLMNILTQINKPRTRYSQKRYRARPDRDHVGNEHIRYRAKTTPRPYYKSLLSLRNSIRCGARDECQDECTQTFDGKKEDQCKETCEVEYECEEEPDCEDTNECDEDNNISTRGPPASAEKPFGCTRC